jgi:hypothetical protein
MKLIFELLRSGQDSVPPELHGPPQQRPDRLIATFAHELAYLFATTVEEPPCEADEIEFLTDLAAVYLGFGVFLANARFEFEVLQDGPLQGWQMGHA